MKNTAHVIGELSAYLDGEVRDPERIARHLQSCPDCARRHVELQELSRHLKALRGPEVHPAFVTRVMAHTTDVQPERSWIPRRSPRLATVLSVAVLAAAGAWRWMPQTPDAPIPVPVALRVNLAWQDDTNVVEALSQLIDSGAPVDLFGDVDEPGDTDDAVVGLDFMLESLAEASADADVVDPFAQDDLSGLSYSTGEDDQPLLNDLLESGGNEV